MDTRCSADGAHKCESTFFRISIGPGSQSTFVLLTSLRSILDALL